MISAFVFDVDNTLYSYDAAHLCAFRAVTGFFCRTFAFTPDAFNALHKQGDALLRARVGSVTAAIHNRLLRYQIMLEQINQPVSYAPQMADLYWSTFLAAMRPDPDLAGCLHALRAGGFTLGIGTNMTAGYQYAKLQRLGILDLFDFIVTSEETGCEKPDRKLFGCCAEKARCPASACAFVGDSLENDAMGALAAGMIPVWLSPARQRTVPPGVTCIASLAELPRLPELLQSKQI